MLHRYKPSSTVMLVLLAAVLCADFCYAHTGFPVFGPKRYEKAKGSPVTYSESLSVPPGNYTLTLRSGENGLQEAKNVSLRINGEEIVTSADLRTANPLTRNVWLQSSNTIDLILKGKPDTFVVLEISGPPMTIAFDMPQSNATIQGGSVLVSGTVNNYFNNETGVTINGTIASIYGNKFAANDVSLTEGPNTITATAVDAAGNTVNQSMTVNADTTAPSLELSSNIKSGIVPMTVDFSVSWSGFTPVVFDMDFEGDGTTDFKGNTFEGISRTYNAEGLYYPRILATDGEGNICSATIALAVYSRANLDAGLKGKWDGMKAAMADKDLEKVMSYFLSSSQDKYRRAFTAALNSLPDMTNDMRPIELISAENGTAEYRIRKTVGAEEITFYIYFTQDKDGLWKIRQF